jgi:glycosyltransferase involved in cell wall biosynthesis
MRLEPAPPAPPPDAVRVVLDARPLQEPERSPLTAWYLDQLLRAYAADPLDGESFILVSRSLRPDPANDAAYQGLPIAASRRIPPTSRTLRSASLTLDSFLLRGAELGTRGAASAEDGPTPAVFHTAGGAVPLASGLPVVATILDLAPWDLPETYAASRAARFGHRVRARVLRDAAQVIVCSRAVAESARRQLHIAEDRITVVPLAVDDEFLAAARDATRLAADRERMALPDRYIAFAGRYDARKDMRTLLRAIALLKTRGGSVPALVIALDIDFPDDHRRVARVVDAAGLAGNVSVVGMTGARQRAAVVAGAEAFVYPALTDATAISVLEALATGVPVISSKTGALPEAVGSAGIVVEPRDPARMASALEAIWAGGPLARQLHDHADRRADASVSRTWADVARETRIAYSKASVNSQPVGDDREVNSRRSGFRRFAIRLRPLTVHAGVGCAPGPERNSISKLIASRSQLQEHHVGPRTTTRVGSRRHGERAHRGRRPRVLDQ